MLLGSHHRVLAADRARHQAGAQGPPPARRRCKEDERELSLAFVPLSHALESDAPTVLVLLSRQNACENLAVRMYARANHLSPSEEAVSDRLVQGLHHSRNRAGAPGGTVHGAHPDQGPAHQNRLHQHPDDHVEGQQPAACDVGFALDHAHASQCHGVCLIMSAHAHTLRCVPSRPSPEPSPAHRRTGRRRGAQRRYRRGALLIQEGDTGRFPLHRAGGPLARLSFRRERQGADAGRRTGQQEYVGEMSLDGGPRSAHVEAAEALVCSVVTRDQLLVYISEQPEFAFELMGRLIRRARLATESARSVALIDVYGRLVRLLNQYLADARAACPGAAAAGAHDPPANGPAPRLFARDGEPLAQGSGNGRLHQRERPLDLGAQTPAGALVSQVPSAVRVTVSRWRRCAGQALIGPICGAAMLVPTRRTSRSASRTGRPDAPQGRVVVAHSQPFRYLSDTSALGARSVWVGQARAVACHGVGRTAKVAYATH